MTRLELSPPRLARWWQRFHLEHPQVTSQILDGEVEIRSTDGTRARFRGWYPLTPDQDPLRGLARVPDRVGLILVRRGGYSIGMASSDGTGWKLSQHKTGTRYVQSRTAAGGWSQQRFARRRANQAEELVMETREQALRILTPLLAGPANRDGSTNGMGSASGLVVGGDRALITQVLADRRLAPLGDLPRREFADIPDPRFSVLQEVLQRARTVAVQVHNP